jgi:hypothetical protein
MPEPIPGGLAVSKISHQRNHSIAGAAGRPFLTTLILLALADSRHPVQVAENALITESVQFFRPSASLKNAMRLLNFLQLHRVSNRIVTRTTGIIRLAPLLDGDCVIGCTKTDNVALALNQPIIL